VSIHVMSQDPDELVPEEAAGSSGPEMVKLKDHPKYQKFFKMLAMGLPVIQVRGPRGSMVMMMMIMMGVMMMMTMTMVAKKKNMMMMIMTTMIVTTMMM
jgi:hypothetical protein